MANHQSRLRQTRRRAALSQQALADVTGIHRVTIATYESGHHQPGVSHALALARALDTSVEELFGEEDR